MSEIRELTYTILKKGRRWLHGETPRGYKAQIEINELTENWETGKQYTFYGKIEFQKSRFGTKVYVYPISRENAEQAVKEQKRKAILSRIEKIKSYLVNAAEEGWVYQKGIKSLDEIIESQTGVLTQEEVEQIRQIMQEIPATALHHKALSLKEELLNQQEKLKTAKTLLKKDPLNAEQNINSYTLSKANKTATKLKEIYNKLEERPEEETQKIIQLAIETHDNYLHARTEAKWIKRITSLLTSFQKDKHNEYLKSKTLKAINEAMKTVENPSSQFLEKISEIKSTVSTLEKSADAEIEAAKERYQEVFNSLSKYLSDTDIFKRLIDGKLKPEKYEEITIPDAWLISKILRELDAAVIAKPGLFTTQYTWLFPVCQKEKVENIVEFMKNWKEKLYNKLQTTPAECEIEDIESAMPHHWNHLKREYVAIIKPSLDLVFISKLTKFSSSGCNAVMEVHLEAVNNGNLVVAKQGSHRHMYHTIYRYQDGKWYTIFGVESRSWSDTKAELFRTMLMPDLEKLLENKEQNSRSDPPSNN